MQTIPRAKASSAQILIHRRLQKDFDKHRDKFEKHRNMGPAFAEALAELEHKLFG